MLRFASNCRLCHAAGTRDAWTVGVNGKNKAVSDAFGNCVRKKQHVMLSSVSVNRSRKIIKCEFQLVVS